MREKVIAKVKTLMNGRQIDDFTKKEFYQEIGEPIMHFIEQEVAQTYPDLKSYDGGPRYMLEGEIAMEVRDYLNYHCNKSNRMWVKYNDWTLRLKENID